MSAQLTGADVLNTLLVPTAVVPSGGIDLTFCGDETLPRRLVLQLARIGGNLTACIYGMKSGCRMLAWASGRIGECQLDTDSTHQYTLWLGHAAFDVTLAEAAVIHAQLAPLGLQSKYREIAS